MPELPEVETIRRFLEAHLTGSTIKKIDVLTPKSFIGNPKLIEGQKIIKLSRLGKQLSFHLQNNLILHFHLKMTGQIVFIPLSSKPARRGGGEAPSGVEGKGILHSRVVLYLKEGVLFFNDQRIFGWIKVFTPTELVEAQQHLGRDLLDPSFSLDYFSSQLNSSRPIKLILLDQNRFAGIGNIYANDALFMAKIHPSAPANHLSPHQIKKLHQSIIDVIHEALSHQGSTAGDNTYVLPDGSKGSHQYFFKVYQRVGESCLVCHAPVKRIVIGGRGTFFCPRCQKT